ncbi:hypothetical protein LTS18_006839 [Coniosporium uncinatum]|uniref:Uncharacterized protein n=1 Tax=Coniosporium uncinatum TaxID=93489 RepID=A0ACC3DXP7_9PEZI|nr:hypothetical protein LTS18_006839 [Coniosporium uncinatum]
MSYSQDTSSLFSSSSSSFSAGAATTPTTTTTSSPPPSPSPRFCEEATARLLRRTFFTPHRHGVSILPSSCSASSSSAGDSDCEDATDCSICLLPLSAPTHHPHSPASRIDAHRPTMAKSCGHIFGRACIVGWFRAGGLTCPMCRVPLFKTDQAADVRKAFGQRVIALDAEGEVLGEWDEETGSWIDFEEE